MERPRRVGVQARDGLLGTRRGPAVRRSRRVDRLDERIVAAPAGVGLGLEEIVESLVPHPLDVGIGEGRLHRDLGRELEGLAQALRRDVDADRQPVPAGFGMDRRAESLRRLGQADRIVVPRPLGERPRHERGNAALVRRLVDRARRQHQRRRHERPTWQVDRDHPEAVRELRAFELREVERPRLAMRRPLGNDHRLLVHRLLVGLVRAHSALVMASLPATGM